MAQCSWSPETAREATSLHICRCNSGRPSARHPLEQSTITIPSQKVTVHALLVLPGSSQRVPPGVRVTLDMCGTPSTHTNQKAEQVCSCYLGNREQQQQRHACNSRDSRSGPSSAAHTARRMSWGPRLKLENCVSMMLMLFARDNGMILTASCFLLPPAKETTGC